MKGQDNKPKNKKSIFERIFGQKKETKDLIQSKNYQKQTHISNLTIRIIMLGCDGSLIYIGVGKSTCLHKYRHQVFTPHICSTIGLDFYSKTVNIGTESIELQIWDTVK